HEYGIDIINHQASIINNNYGAIILAVAHNEFKEIDIEAFKKTGSIIYDVKGILPKELVNSRL
ncbi:MAG: nucleotide sugar dehydrogenase, partial [Bacteroidota bacterium]|nr:nucleotide sugar dehydrogenase [Bacteroidota bacterium]